MYLVLTALLALNVSAEVMNAFFDLDKSMKTSNKLTKAGVKSTTDGIQGLLDKKPLLKAPLNEGISQVSSKVNEFVDYINGVQDNLIDQSGNRDGAKNEGDYIDEDMNNKPKGKKNKDVTTRILVLGDDATGTAPVGPDIEAKVGELKKELIAIYSSTIKNADVMKEGKLTAAEVDERIAGIVASIPLKIESAEEIMAKSKDGKEKSWSEYKFKQMPLAAVLPVMTKLQSDARNAEATIVNKLAELVGGREIKLNKFFPVINAKKGYVIKGEKFESEVSIGAYSSEFAKTSSITVNGQRVALNAEGKGNFTETANSYGKKTLKLVANVTNPLSGEKFTESSTFEYEVGERSATVSATKMNVFYIGVDNPLEVSVAGAPSSQVKVNGGGGISISGSGGKYNVTASKPGPVKVNVNAPGLGSKAFDFRVKRIPDPVPVLGAGPNKKGGVMGNGEFKAQLGLAGILEGFDFDAKCKIAGYDLTRVANRQDPVSSKNGGARYNDKSSRLVNAAKPGDTYYFDNVKARCPGDSAGRRLSSVVFKIK